MITTYALDDFAINETAFRFEGRQAADGADIGWFVTRTLPGKGATLHVHPYAEVFCLLQGTAAYTAGDETVTVEAGTVVVVPPNTPHRFENVGDEPLLQFSVHERGAIVQHEV